MTNYIGIPTIQYTIPMNLEINTGNTKDKVVPVHTMNAYRAAETNIMNHC